MVVVVLWLVYVMLDILFVVVDSDLGFGFNVEFVEILVDVVSWVVLECWYLFVIVCGSFCYDVGVIGVVSLL